ncbi:MAG: protoporphyrinogen oxidase [Acidobacteriaceae bacterium]|jgi:oxygen-dependent protoporphyrinogen oxidase|nr:protoporphyrinogen oxidase [Acidobacteriaceae bacterium]
MPDRPPVIIVGGGIAGLAAAYELHRESVPFLLLEAGTRVGGVILSERVDGFVFDGGPDSLLAQKPEGIQLCRELGIADRLVPTLLPRQSFIQRGGQLHPLPAGSVLGIPTTVGPFLRTTLFSWPGKLRMGAEWFLAPKQSDEDESIGQFMTRRFGREATEFLAEPLLAGIHAGDVDRLSMKALFQRLTDTERDHGSLIRAFRAQKPPAGPNLGPFRSLPGGLSELVHALSAALPSACVRTNTPVRTIAPVAGGYRVETGHGEALLSDTVILAAPAFAAAAIVRDLDAALSSLCGGIEYASAVTVALAFERDAVRHPMNGSGFVVPRAERTGILAASWLSSKWPHRAPADKILMRAFLGGTRDPGAIERPDDELIHLALDALRPLLGISAAPLLTRIFRWPQSNAQHNVGHLDRMAAIDRALTRWPGLHVTGSGYRGTGIPDCVADGRRIAREAVAARAVSAAQP